MYCARSVIVSVTVSCDISDDKIMIPYYCYKGIPAMSWNNTIDLYFKYIFYRSRHVIEKSVKVCCLKKIRLAEITFFLNKNVVR